MIKIGNHAYLVIGHLLDRWLRMVVLPLPLGNFVDIFYLEENFKLCRIRDVCTMCSGA